MKALVTWVRRPSFVCSPPSASLRVGGDPPLDALRHQEGAWGPSPAPLRPHSWDPRGIRGGSAVAVQEDAARFADALTGFYSAA